MNNEIKDMLIRQIKESDLVTGARFRIIMEPVHPYQWLDEYERQQLAFFTVWDWIQKQEWFIDFVESKTFLGDNQLGPEGIFSKVGLIDFIKVPEFFDLLVVYGKEKLGWT